MLPALVLLAMLGIAGCGPAAAPSDLQGNESARPPGGVTLYDRLGGGEAIYALTDDFVDRTLADPRVNFQREGHAHTWTATPDSIAKLKLYWAQFLDSLADGPQAYEGRNLLESHHGMDISEGEWLALMDDLKKSLDHYRVPTDEQNELLRRVASTHNAVVNH